MNFISDKDNHENVKRLFIEQKTQENRLQHFSKMFSSWSLFEQVSERKMMLFYMRKIGN